MTEPRVCAKMKNEESLYGVNGLMSKVSKEELAKTSEVQGVSETTRPTRHCFLRGCSMGQMWPEGQGMEVRSGSSKESTGNLDNSTAVPRKEAGR